MKLIIGMWLGKGGGGWHKKRGERGVENLQLVCNIDLACILVRHYGLSDVMDDVCYDKNQIFIRFVVNPPNIVHIPPLVSSYCVFFYLVGNFDMSCTLFKTTIIAELISLRNYYLISNEIIDITTNLYNLGPDFKQLLNMFITKTKFLSNGF